VVRSDSVTDRACVAAELRRDLDAAEAANPPRRCRSSPQAVPREVGPGAIPLDDFAGLLRRRFEATGKVISDATVAAVLDLSGGAPYTTQAVAYFVWDETAVVSRRRAGYPGSRSPALIVH
jgi:hypothetical protein